MLTETWNRIMDVIKPSAEEPAPAAPIIVYRPFPGCWWVAEKRFLAGGFPGAPDPTIMRYRLEALVDAGIRCVISLQEPNETDRRGRPFPDYREALQEAAAARGQTIECLNEPIPDMGVPSKATMVRILDTIDRALVDARPVYVHCWGGHGRTGTVVGCWLLRHGHDPERVLETLRQQRTCDPHLTRFRSPQTTEQRRMVVSWNRPA